MFPHIDEYHDLGYYLPGNCDLIVVLIPDGAAVLVTVVKRDADGRLGDARLPVFVYQLLQAAGADLPHEIGRYVQNDGLLEQTLWHD